MQATMHAKSKEDEQKVKMTAQVRRLFTCVVK